MRNPFGVSDLSERSCNTIITLINTFEVAHNVDLVRFNNKQEAEDFYKGLEVLKTLVRWN